MAETLPDDWEAQVSRAYSTFGMDPVEGADEFAFHGFPRLSVDFLRRKAEQQLRDRLGRWRQERGSLAPDADPFQMPGRSSTGKFTHPEFPNPASPLPPDPPGIREIEQDKIAYVLSKAGWPKARARRWAERGRVFRYSDDNKNATFLFVADPEVAVSSRIEGMTKRLEKAQETKQAAEERLAAAGKMGGTSVELLTARAQRAAKDVDDYAKSLEKEKEWWRKVHGYTPENTSEEFTQQLVDDAGKQLKKAIDGSPDWKKRLHRAFMIEFDESAMMADSTQQKIVPAQSKRGGNVISMDRSQYFDSTDTLPDDWSMPTDATYFGEYSIPHEVGHLVDELNVTGYWSSMQNRDLWDQTIRDGLMSTYGKGNPREGYAEAYAMWLHNPDHPVARAYAEYFQWDRSRRTRPGVDDATFDEAYWESILSDNYKPDTPEWVVEEDILPDPFAAAAPRRLTGNEALAALHAAGYNANEAALYASSGEVFTRDGKVFSFHKYPSTVPFTRRARDLRDQVRALKRNPRTNEPYARLPANVKAQVQVLEREIRSLDKKARDFWTKPRKLSAADVRNAKIALRDMEAGVKKLPKWRRDEGGPFMAEVDPDMQFFSEGKMTAGQAVAGSNTITLNTQLFDPAWRQAANIESPRNVVFHELGHVVDARPYDPGSSRSAGGFEAHAIGKTLEGMTPYGYQNSHEGYAEMLGKWLAGDRSSPAVQFYARVFGWSASVRRNPTPATVKALAKRMGIVNQGAAASRNTGSSWSRRT
jgi:hypothetical protein